MQTFKKFVMCEGKQERTLEMWNQKLKVRRAQAHTKFGTPITLKTHGTSDVWASVGILGVHVVFGEIFGHNRRLRS